MSLNSTTQHLFCYDMIPVFNQIFTNLKAVSLIVEDGYFDFGHFENFANSLQQLDVLYINYKADYEDSIVFEREIRRLYYEKSARTFDRLVFSWLESEVTEEYN